MEVWAVPFGELNGHQSAGYQEENNKDVYDQAALLGIFGHRYILQQKPVVKRVLNLVRLPYPLKMN